jgi:hypothetical protein
MNKWRHYLIGTFSIKRLVKSFCSIYLMLWIYIIFFGDSLIFVPPEPRYSSESEHITLISRPDSETQLATYYRPAKAGMPTLLWSHGNAEDLSMTYSLELFHQAGFGIYAYDYPGYGMSGGQATEENCYAAIKTAYKDLQQRHNVSNTNIILVGQSVGSGPTTYLAEREMTRGMVLISPFKSIYRVAFGFPIFIGDRFSNINHIKKITTPLMVIHGENDEIIPQSHGKSLVEQHSGTHRFVGIKGRGHNDIYGNTTTDIEAFIGLFLDFNQSLTEEPIVTPKK